MQVSGILHISLYHRIQDLLAPFPVAEQGHMESQGTFPEGTFRFHGQHLFGQLEEPFLFVVDKTFECQCNEYKQVVRIQQVCPFRIISYCRIGFFRIRVVQAIVLSVQGTQAGKDDS